MATAPAANRKQRRAEASTQRAGKPVVLPEFVQAARALQAGDFARTRTIAESIVAKQPSNADAWNLAGIAAARSGNTEEAISIFERAIAQAPQGFELHKNLAVILNQKQPERAEQLLKRALEIKPDYDEAAWGLGNLYCQQNRLEEAERVLRVGMAANATLAKYPLQLAKVLHARSQHPLMEPVLAEAIARARAGKDISALTEGLVMMGGLLYYRGERLKALPFLHEAIQRGTDNAGKSLFAQCISKVRFAAPYPQFEVLLTQAFREVWIRPAEIMRVSTNLLFFKPAFKESLALLDTPYSEVAWLEQPCIRTVTADPLLLTLMAATMVGEPALERLLTTCRRALLDARMKNADIAPFTPLAIALAHQGFANEYAFFFTVEEETAIVTLERTAATALDAGKPVAVTDIALLAAYRPLHRLPFAKKLLAATWPQELEDVITRQVREPLEEQALLDAIPCITPITDAVSEAVRDQYEENPYPRWMEAPSAKESFTLASWLRAYFPEMPKPDGDYADPLEILVAGCGTGQQSVNSALRFKRANLLAVDLSRASLAYAIRKTKELKLTNVTYAQGDILELGTLDRVFDMVECGGVLHHLASPLKGWRVLTDLTRPGGYMTIALYSEIARRYLEPVRAYAKEQGFGSSAEELHRFRAAVLALPSDHPAAMLTQRRDFYSLSMVRDLVFHVQEHRFTLPQIADALKQLRLEFGGFSVAPETKRKFFARFGAEANLLSLDQWAVYEEEVPETFLGMYQFLVKKPLA